MGKIIIISALMTFLVSCNDSDKSFNTALEKLRSAQQVQYLTLKVEPNENAKEYFYKWEKLGQATIKKEDLEKLLKDLTLGYEKGKKAQEEAACFDPRHVLKVDSEDKVEILICFACGKIRINLGEESTYKEIRMERKVFDQVAEKYKLKLERP